LSIAFRVATLDITESAVSDTEFFERSNWNCERESGFGKTWICGVGLATLISRSAASAAAADPESRMSVRTTDASEPLATRAASRDAESEERTFGAAGSETASVS
jgi:hypothetical protein